MRINLDSKPIKRDMDIYLLCTLIVLIHFSTHLLLDVPLSTSIYFETIIRASILTGTLAMIVNFIRIIIIREKKPIRAFLSPLLHHIKNPYESINLIIILCFVSVVFSIYTTTKQFIPNLVPFYLDPFLVKADYYLHFNNHPWELTHKLFNTSFLSGTLNLFYNLWFFFFWIFLMYFCFSKSRESLRKNSIITFLLCWVINGNILAILFSSAGPCYYDNLYQNSAPFGALFEVLNAQNLELVQNNHFLGIWSLNIQDLLWQSYISGSSTFGGGISAMPSMHVSVATLMALSLANMNRILGLLGWLYLIIILIGSVHLGWHYALDGYISILTTVAIWYAVKKYLPSSINRTTESTNTPSLQQGL
ncbi:hypothetical protein MAQ5080_01483 [Marinomonas aquimarina]|uniref:Inositolphosphotransferase Aur1/Ipt1 domain-containing protein n=2 Tax=Marinomonas aquimarina TaxID=295068 RepID=A0A1A8TA71_9GAMM|nr:hypothetical protein MAQ5080_01483 [Marinomonas aquimarina]